MLAEVNNNADSQVYHYPLWSGSTLVIRALFQKGRPNPSTILQESFCLFVFGTPECGKHERPTCHPSLLNIHAYTCAYRKVPGPFGPWSPRRPPFSSSSRITALCPYPAANHSGVSPFMNFPVALEFWSTPSFASSSCATASCPFAAALKAVAHIGSVVVSRAQRKADEALLQTAEIKAPGEAPGLGP
jgi:hypothetical protein